MILMRRWVRATALFLPFVACPLLGQGIAQNPAAAEVVVIEGGLLIDGTGGAPRPDVAILIRNGKIQEIGVRSQFPPHAEARVIDAKGKFIIPGLTDSHVHYFGYEGELYLNHGVTTVMSLGGIPEWDKAQGDAIARGLVVGPRIFTAGYILGIPPGGAPFPHILPADNREEAVQAVRTNVDKGADYIKIYSGVRSPEVVQAIAAEAHRAGKRVVAHLGPSINAREAVMAGVDLLAHASGVPAATIQDAELRKRMAQTPNLGSAGPASLMQPEHFGDLIKLLVDKGVYLEPDLVTSRGIHPLGAKFLWEAAVLLSDEGLSYISDDARRRWFRFAGVGDHERIKTLQEGYRKFTQFLRQFVQAGGKVLAGSDTEAPHPPGISLHQELELLVDSGVLSPMQAIIAATRNPADFLGRTGEMGTVEKNRIADLVILNSNPLENISNTRDIFAVLKGGKLVDRTYHRYFTNPLPRPWMAGGMRNAAPRLDPFPAAVSCGASKVTVTLRGTHFMPASFVRLNGVGQDIEFVSPTEMRTALNCKELTIPGTYTLVVVNPKPISYEESEESNAVKFIVTR